MNHKRNHLKIFYDELWAEHIKLSTGKIVKPFKDRHKFGKAPLSIGFKNQKPEIFKQVDEKIKKYASNANNLIELADNRMQMGDYRYGYILRQNLDNYDLLKEFFRRLNIAKATLNYEYIVDAYNMYRIYAFKTKNIIIQDMLIILLNMNNHAVFHSWKLESIDDGIHAEEK